MIKKNIILALVSLSFLFSIYFLLEIGAVRADTALVFFDIENSAPSVPRVNLNSGRNIVLTEGATTSVLVSGAVADNNSCQDLVSIKMAMHLEGAICASEVDAINSDVCYFYEDMSPAIDPSCTGSSDLSYAVSHYFDVYYYANPGTWIATVIAFDSVASSSGNSSTVSLNELLSLDVSAIVDFGVLFINATSSGDNMSIITNSGNITSDLRLSGTNLSCASGTIPVNYQEYSLSSFEYGFGTTLTTRSADLNAVLPAPAYNTIPITDSVYWQVEIPADVSGVCNSVTTFVAIVEAA